MTRNLLILRSGKGSKGWDGRKRERPLRDRGKRQVQRIGVWLSEHDLVPDRVVTATSERAKVSAQKALKAAGVGARGIRQDRRLDTGGRAAMLEVLHECPPGARPVMLVLDRAAFHALRDHLLPERTAALTAGTLLRLRLPDDWSELSAGGAVLEDHVRPEDLPEKFPFDGPDGRDYRDRPSYYYTQSAVLPYRVGASGIELLLIGSSKRTHWVVPKGIHDPGYSAQASAAREAEEEAGIFGEVAPEPLGSYDVFKWGATCRVALYPMKVTGVLSEDEWEESHRHRIWVSPDQAVDRLKDEGLRRLIADFAAGSPS